MQATCTLEDFGRGYNNQPPIAETVTFETDNGQTALPSRTGSDWLHSKNTHTNRDWASSTEDQPPVDLSALAPPPTRAIRGEDAPIPLRENNGFDPAAWDAAAACGASGAATPVGTDRAGANIVAALNFNAKRVPFSPFDEASDGKLGSVYTRVTETLLHRGDWDRKPA